ncbi:DUF4105 domain-containing protein [Luteimonas marina]|uniref:DUF4105 domain-containing protein n=1 Tax=Luteimonas marina TaxID=488485 RepID=A0A5C5UBG4_9GAMM|nr:DUF4105 domain-containing protein [Luteimonas marina]TWT23434.1 DUF4105 domain-containing protein [Luteimonas marina]
MRFPARAWLLAGLLACAAPAPAALRLEVDDAGLSADEAAATRDLADHALALLPPTFRERLDESIVLRWRDDLPAQVHGRARNGRIGLQRELLGAWMRRDASAREISPPDQVRGRNDRIPRLVISTEGRNLPGSAAGIDEPAARAALATLLHELAHLYDRSPHGGLSRDPRLLDLAGWPVRPLRFGLRTTHNDLRDRSPDAYELASPVEYFAVNFEHFLLDPDYACRRPALHRHLVAHFGASPQPTPACTQDLPFVGAGEDDAALRLQALDPARVQSVEYLFAEANEQPMSRWGHAMLRLVVCAPGRPRGPDCRLDLEHHVVLSFRAFVDDVQVSSWRGQTGSYPARLFVLPLAQVVDEYTKVELRGLQSIPLRLDQGEVAALLERAAQVHWSYDGRYYFVGNNCAVETWKLLNDGVPRLSRAKLRSVTPTGLLRRLQREGIADVSVLDDAAAALREGYRFESMAAYFDDMFAVVEAAMALPARDAQAWLSLDPARRTPFHSNGDLRATAALLVLEQAALRRGEAQAREALKQRFLRGGGDGMDAVAGRLRELLADGAYAGRPALLLPGEGYGLPQADERERLAAAVERDDARLRGLRDDLYRQAREWLPPEQRARLEDTEANLALLGDRLRAMQGAQVGSLDASAR